MPPVGDYTNGRLIGLQNRCDAQVNQVQQVLEDKQLWYETEGHIAKWQGLSTTYGPVVHGSSGNDDGDREPDTTGRRPSDRTGDREPHALGRKPNDRTEDWEAFMPEINQVLPFSVTVDDFQAEDELGFIAHYDFVLDVDHFRRSLTCHQIIEWVEHGGDQPIEQRHWVTEDTDWLFVEPDGTVDEEEQASSRRNARG